MGRFDVQKCRFCTPKVPLSHVKTAYFEMFSTNCFREFLEKRGGKRSPEMENRDGKCGFLSPFCRFWYEKCRFWYNEFLRFFRLKMAFFIYIPMSGIAAGYSGEAEIKNSWSRNRVYKKRHPPEKENRRISENRVAQRCCNM